MCLQPDQQVRHDLASEREVWNPCVNPRGLQPSRRYWRRNGTFRACKGGGHRACLHRLWHRAAGPPGASSANWQALQSTFGCTSLRALIPGLSTRQPMTMPAATLVVADLQAPGPRATWLDARDPDRATAAGTRCLLEDSPTTAACAPTRRRRTPTRSGSPVCTHAWRARWHWRTQAMRQIVKP